MNLVKAVLVAALATTTGTFVPRGEGAPLPTSIATMKAALETPVVQVRYGRWGYPGGVGYRGWGHRGWGYGGWGLGGVAAGAIVGGAIARSAYYGGAYPYYGEGFAYDSGYAGDYCAPYGYGGNYPGYAARHYYYGW